MEQFTTRFVSEFMPPFHNPVLIFTLILVIIFLAPIVLRRIKIPGIIVLIISGMLVGPHGFNLIERNEAVALFSTIGLLYIMFLAGLELNLLEFSRNKNKSLIFGALTFMIPLLVGFPVCYYVLGYGTLSSILTASMFATHTLIAYPIVSKRNLSQEESVSITIGGTIITDTAVLLILAIINSTQGTVSEPAYWFVIMLSFALFFIFLFTIVPRFSKWVLKQIENDRYAHFIFVLATVFFAAFLAELAGLEPIIGSFMAGLVLNKLIPKTSPLMNRIEFAGNALFIPFFLISVGMIIDLRSLATSTETIFIAIVLTIVAISSKWLAAYFSSTILHYNKWQRNLIFGLSSSHAVATLAVITVGYKTGFLDLNILNGTIILIFISCIVASMVTEKATKNLAIHRKTDIVPVKEMNMERILVPVSNPETMSNLMDLALNIVQPKLKTPVFALSIVDDNQHASTKLSESRAALEKLIRHGSETDRKIKVLTTIDQNIANGIRRVVKEVAATDIVIGASERSRFFDLIFGSMVTHLMNSTTQIIFVYKSSQSLFSHTGIQVILPPYSEKEIGFNNCIKKIITLANNLNIPCTFLSNSESTPFIKELVSSCKLPVSIHYKEFDLLAGNDVNQIIGNETDLITVIQPREGSLSSFHETKNLLLHIEQTKSENPILIISPNHNNPSSYQ